jgi:antitoxin component of MazEF toxin-antitoxin module
MARQRITTAEDGASLVLDPDVLRLLGLHPGDEVDVAVVDRTVVVRPLDEVERARALDAVTQAVIRRRQHALQRLSDEPAP